MMRCEKYLAGSESPCCDGLACVVGTRVKWVREKRGV